MIVGVMDLGAVDCHMEQIAMTEDSADVSWRVVQKISSCGIPSLSHIDVTSEYSCTLADPNQHHSRSTLTVSSLVNTAHPVSAAVVLDSLIEDWIARTHKASHGAWMAQVASLLHNSRQGETDILATSQVAYY